MAFQCDAKAISDPAGDYRRYLEVVGEEEGLLADNPASIAEDLDNTNLQEVSLETGDVSFFTTKDDSVIFTVLVRLSQTVSTSGFKFSDFVQF